MGLEQFDVAPDNKGGRPESEEEGEENQGRAHGRSLVIDSVDDEWWEEVLEEVLGRKTLPCDDYQEFARATMRLADYTHSLGHSVWFSLRKEGAGDVDWEWFKEEAPDESVRRVFPEEYQAKKSTSTRFGSSAGKQPSDGLSSIIDAAK